MLLTLYLPSYDDLWFREEMLSDEETMSYNHAYGGTIDFSKKKWDKWFDKWIINPGNERYYRYLLSENSEFIGEIAYHYDSELNGYVANVIIHFKYRGKGYGTLGLELLTNAARENGIDILYDDIAIDNPATSIFLKQGFKEEYRTKEKIILKKVL